MAIKVELNPETLSPERRRPGYALLKLSGWTHAPGESVLAVQRNQDGKFLGLNGQWQPTPIWHPLQGMAFDQNGWLCGDVTPALVDPLVAEPNVVYRAELKADGTKQQGVIRIAGGVLASSASGERSLPSETGAGFIATEAPKSEPKTKVVVKADLAKVSKPEPVKEPEPEPALVSEPKPDSDSLKPPLQDQQIKPRRLWALIVSIAVFVLLLSGAGVAWWRGWFPFDDKVDPVINPIPDPNKKPEEKDEEKPEETDEKRTDLELLQRFLKTKPTSEQILAQAETWEKDKHCDAMRRLMVYGAQKTSDANIAFAYAQKYDPITFQNRGCITEADADSATFWYEIPANSGNVQAQYRLGRLLTEMHRSGYQHDQGVEYLGKAAQAGNAEAKMWLEKMGP